MSNPDQLIDEIEQLIVKREERERELLRKKAEGAYLQAKRLEKMSNEEIDNADILVGDWVETMWVIPTPNGPSYYSSGVVQVVDVKDNKYRLDVREDNVLEIFDRDSIVLATPVELRGKFAKEFKEFDEEYKDVDDKEAPQGTEREST